jgi:hypothetical protein
VRASERKPLVLKQRHADILKAVHTYRYVTAAQITRLFYAPSSITHVREMLADLCGNEDQKERQYLYRFALPNTRIGNTERIYTLGSAGRAYLEETLGIVCEWYYRPSGVSARSYYHLKHALALTDFLVAAQVYSNSQQEIKLATVRTQYELERTPAHIAVTSRNRTETVKVVPDAWLDFTLQGEHSPILLEIDRATEEEKKFKAHVKARVEFIKPEGRYKQFFDTNAVTIAYATTGNENRLKHMINWTENVLTELGKQNYADSFRFCSLPDDFSTSTLFDSASWYRPFDTSPLLLFS